VRKILVIIAFALAGSSCGYDGHYRYVCQDPANWGAEECNPPICKADGACSKDLIGFDPEENLETSVETVPTEETVVP
jgi:hypothetical protein